MNTYKRHRFPPEMISYAVWLYYRLNLSHRDIREHRNVWGTALLSKDRKIAQIVVAKEDGIYTSKFSGSATRVQKMIYPLQPAYLAYT